MRAPIQVCVFVRRCHAEHKQVRLLRRVTRCPAMRIIVEFGICSTHDTLDVVKPSRHEMSMDTDLIHVAWTSRALRPCSIQQVLRRLSDETHAM